MLYYCSRLHNQCIYVKTHITPNGLHTISLTHRKSITYVPTPCNDSSFPTLIYKEEKEVLSIKRTLPNNVILMN
jgi:hypothetical protein